MVNTTITNVDKTNEIRFTNGWTKNSDEILKPLIKKIFESVGVDIPLSDIETCYFVDNKSKLGVAYKVNYGYHVYERYLLKENLFKQIVKRLNSKLPYKKDDTKFEMFESLDDLFILEYLMVDDCFDVK